MEVRAVTAARVHQGKTVGVLSFVYVCSKLFMFFEKGLLEVTEATERLLIPCSWCSLRLTSTKTAWSCQAL
jgi:hypothetical protein